MQDSSDRPDFDAPTEREVAVSRYRHGATIDGRSVREHAVIAARALGRPLVQPEEVHHVDGDRLNNVNSNLVVCPDRAYHMLLHRRQRALDACGNPNWLKCRLCMQYDAPGALTVLKRHSGRAAGTDIVYHPACSTLVSSRLAAKRKAQRSLFVCNECGKRYTLKQAERAMLKGCKAGCSGLDIFEVFP